MAGKLPALKQLELNQADQAIKRPFAATGTGHAGGTAKPALGEHLMHNLYPTELELNR